MREGRQPGEKSRPANFEEGHTASGTATIQSAFGASAGVGSFGPELLVLAALTGAALGRRRYALGHPKSERRSR